MSSIPTPVATDSLVEIDDHKVESKSQKDFLQQWATSCKTRSFHHRIQNRKNTRLYQMLTLPNIVCSTVASALSYITIGGTDSNLNQTTTATTAITPEDTTTEALTIAAAILVTLSTVLIGVINFLEPGKIAEKHLQASMRYEILALDITQFLATSRHSQIEWTATHEKFGKQYQDIIMHSPSLGAARISD